MPADDEMNSCVPTFLHAGPLSLVYTSGEIRYVRLGEYEIVRRVYVTVRDEGWGTVVPRISNLKAKADDDEFVLSFQGEHKAGGILFVGRDE